MLGITGGVGFFGAEVFKKAQIQKIETPYGPVEVLEVENIFFLPRHGIKGKVPPHMVNHHANMFALKNKGITKIIGMNSVGSLKLEIPPPSILIPSDYINIWEIPTIFDKDVVHVVPALDEDLRNQLISQSKKQGLEIIDKGIYVQTKGPRLETRAEVSMLCNFADVVGMTMASEATLARELGLTYASMCSVDNYANGIVDEPLDNDKILANATVNGDKIRDFIFKAQGELQ
jgi:5'-methylthioadenosine phosphorylase